MSEAERESLREVAEAATHGPWECDETSGVDDLHMGHVSMPVLEPMGYYGPRLKDCRYMAAFDPPTVLALLDALASRDALLAEQAATIAQLDGLLKDLEGVLRRGRRHLKKSVRASATFRPDPSEACDG